jgi:selenophosphate synthetase-related protein
MSDSETLAGIVDVLRAAPGWRGKAAIAVVGDVLGPADWLRGPGDDGAVVAIGSEEVVACGEAILPAFVERDPYGAGIAAVLTNVNDVAAMGALPMAVVDTVVGPVETCRAALEGMRYASELYDVPVVGGHLTISSDRVALSAFGVGRCIGPALSAARVAPGHRLGLIACLEGTMRADFPFFPSFDERGKELAADVRLLASLAADGVVIAAKDVSMAGLFGSLAMLLEPTGCGVTIALDAVPRPSSVPFLPWATCFPCLAFLVTMSPEAELACRAAVDERGLTYGTLGEVDDTGRVVLTRGDESATVVDLGVDQVTGLRPSPR